MKQNTNRQSNTLHISVSCLCKDLILSGLDIVDDGSLEEGKFEVIALSIDDGIERSCQFVELDSIVSNIN